MESHPAHRGEAVTTSFLHWTHCDDGQEAHEDKLPPLHSRDGAETGRPPEYTPQETWSWSPGDRAADCQNQGAHRHTSVSPAWPQGAGCASVSCGRGGSAADAHACPALPSAQRPVLSVSSPTHRSNTSNATAELLLSFISKRHRDHTLLAHK